MKFYVIYNVPHAEYHRRSRWSGAPKLFDTAIQAEKELQKIEYRENNLARITQNTAHERAPFNADEWEIHEVSLNSIRKV